MFAPKFLVALALRDARVIHANPARIDHWVGTNVALVARAKKQLSRFPGTRKRATTLLTRIAPFVVPSADYVTPVPISATRKHARIVDLLRCGQDYRSSMWYREMHSRLRAHGSVHHRDIIITTPNELDAFFVHYVLALVSSIGKHGYCIKKGSSLGNVMIGPSGELHKSNAATHRFLIARELGISTFPFLVSGIHEQWVHRTSVSSFRGLAISIRAAEDMNR